MGPLALSTALLECLLLFKTGLDLKKKKCDGEVYLKLTYFYLLTKQKRCS